MDMTEEPGDPELMRVSPRPKKSNIMTLHWWIYGNLPHCFFEAMSVLACLTLALYIFTGHGKRRLENPHDSCWTLQLAFLG